MPLSAPDGITGFGADLYFSGTTLLGRGDVTALDMAGRVVTVMEVGTGFGLLAMVIGYLPVLYQAFSRREEHISLLDAHAGSPPTAAALLLRHPPHRRAAPAPSPASPRRAGHEFACRVGNMVGGIIGKPSFVSAARLLSLTA